MNSLINGKLDVALNLKPNQSLILENTKNVELLNVPVLRVVYWQFDSLGKAQKTALMDKRVRQAIWHAIDRKNIIRIVLKDRAEFLDSLVHPLQFGYDPSVRGLNYNPEKAKKLLQEAGHADGFTIDLWEYYDEQHLFNQSAMNYLKDVGIEVILHDLRGKASELEKLLKSNQLAGIANYSYGSFNIFDADAILADWFLLDSNRNYAGDKHLSDLIIEARSTVAYFEREELYSKAIRIIMDEVYWMPCFIMHRISGSKTDLHLIIGVDEVPRFTEAYFSN